MLEFLDSIYDDPAIVAVRGQSSLPDTSENKISTAFDYIQKYAHSTANEIVKMIHGNKFPGIY